MDDKKNRNLRQYFGLGSSTYLLIVILLVSASLRIFDLGIESYWIDEMSTVIEGQQSLQQMFFSGRLDQPPAFYVPFHFWLELFGTAETSARSFSALVGVGTVFLIYLIGRELFGWEVGLIAAFLTAISQFQIIQSQAARFYGFFEFMTLVSFLFFILALRSRSKLHLFFYILVSVLMILSHTYGVFILVAQNLIVFLQWKKYRNLLIFWGIGQLMIALALLPYLYPLVFGEAGMEGAVAMNIGGSPMPTFLDPIRSIYRFIMPIRHEQSWIIIAFYYILAVFFVLIGVVVYSAKQGKENVLGAINNLRRGIDDMPEIAGKISLVTCWLLCPILLPFVFSWVIGPIYQDRYTISAAPALYLLLAFAVFQIRKVVPLVFSLGAFLIVILPGLQYYYVNDTNEQWDEAASYVTNHSGMSDVILFVPNMGIGIQEKTFNWYYRGPLQSCGLSNLVMDKASLSREFDQCASGYSRFWVILYGNAVSLDQYESFFLDNQDAGFVLMDEKKYKAITIYLFEFTK
jgi:mannosyltransferase